MIFENYFAESEILAIFELFVKFRFVRICWYFFNNDQLKISLYSIENLLIIYPNLYKIFEFLL